MSYILICSYVYVNVTHIGHIQCSHLVLWSWLTSIQGQWACILYVKYALMRINKKCQISIYHLGKIWISNKLGFFFYKICNSSFVSATVNCNIRQNKTVSLFSDVVSYPLCWISNASLWISPMSSTLQMTEAKVTLRMTLSWSSNS